MAWAATSRPQDEHDLLGGMLLERLLRASDQQQAQTLGWGVTSLKGPSEEARLKTVQSILAALPAQASPDLRQSYVWTVSQLATLYGSRAVDQSFHDIRWMVEDARRRGNGAAWSAQLEWLLHELERHREEKGG
jgi:hypothetical protein